METADQSRARVRCPSRGPDGTRRPGLSTTSNTVSQPRRKTSPYQVGHHLLHVLCAFFHLILGPSELDNVTFLRWVWKVDDDLEQTITNSSSVTGSDWIPEQCPSTPPGGLENALGNPHLWEFVPNLTDPLALLANDGAVEPLLDEEVLGALVLLEPDRRRRCSQQEAAGRREGWGAPLGPAAPRGVGSQPSTTRGRPRSPTTRAGLRSPERSAAAQPSAGPSARRASAAATGHVGKNKRPRGTNPSGTQHGSKPRHVNDYEWFNTRQETRTVLVSPTPAISLKCHEKEYKRTHRGVLIKEKP